MSTRTRIAIGASAIIAVAAAISAAVYFQVMRPALLVQEHKKALEATAAIAREKRHSLPSDAELYEFNQHVDALVELGYFEEREFRVDMSRLQTVQRQLFRDLERQAEGLPIWDWKPTLEKDAIVITVRARPVDMEKWETIIGRYG